jgi:hypothetical protein
MEVEGATAVDEFAGIAGVPRSPLHGSGRAGGGSFANLTASVPLKTDLMAHRTTIVTRRAEAGQPARSWRAATQGLPPGRVVVAAVAVIVVLVPVLVTIAQAFGGGPTAAFSAIKATSATTLRLHTSLVTAPAGANRQDLRADRRFTAADMRV